MNIPSFSVTAIARASIIPADPLASGAYEVGSSRNPTAFADVNQVFAITGTDIAGSLTLDLQAGTLTGATGGTLTGGDGKDPDGEDVNLAKLMVFHIRNTGANPINFENSTHTGTDRKIIEFLSIHPGGEALITAPDGSDFTAQTLDVFEPDAGIFSFEMCVIGESV